VVEKDVPEARRHVPEAAVDALEPGVAGWPEAPEIGERAAPPAVGANEESVSPQDDRFVAVHQRRPRPGEAPQEAAVARA
jgi:hypothetical protein